MCYKYNRFKHVRLQYYKNITIKTKQKNYTHIIDNNSIWYINLNISVILEQHFIILIQREILIIHRIQ